MKHEKNSKFSFYFRLITYRPAYSPDVYTMLHGMRANRVEYKFYEANIGLPELLTITDERLQQIGIDYPYHRKRILLGLLQFHERPWSKDALTIPKINTNIVDMFNVLSNCLKQLIVIETTIKFVDEHPIFATIPMSIEAKQQRLTINQELQKLRKNIQQILGIFEQVWWLFLKNNNNNTFMKLLCSTQCSTHIVLLLLFFLYLNLFLRSTHCHQVHQFLLTNKPSEMLWTKAKHSVLNSIGRSPFLVSSEWALASL